MAEEIQEYATSFQRSTSLTMVVLFRDSELRYRAEKWRDSEKSYGAYENIGVLYFREFTPRIVAFNVNIYINNKNNLTSSVTINKPRKKQQRHAWKIGKLKREREATNYETLFKKKNV